MIITVGKNSKRRTRLFLPLIIMVGAVNMEVIKVPTSIELVRDFSFAQS